MRFRKNFARTLVRHQIEIALAIARLDIRQAMPFLGQRPERLREHFEFVHLQSRLARLGQETTALHSDEIAEIEQPEDFHRLRPQFLRLHVNLDAPGRVAQIEKMALSHVAMRRDPAGSAQRLAFGKFLAHFGNASRSSRNSARRAPLPARAMPPVFWRRSAINSFSSSIVCRGRGQRHRM